MEKQELDQHWKNFIDEVAGVFHWSCDNGDGEGVFRSGLEGDMPLGKNLDRLYISKELSKIFKKYNIPLHRDLYYTMEAILREIPKEKSVKQ